MYRPEAFQLSRRHSHTNLVCSCIIWKCFNLEYTMWGTLLFKQGDTVSLAALAIMVTLPAFQLPLRPNAPPTGYGWSDRPLSEISTTTAFNTGLDNRDVFLGIACCVVCGASKPEHCHIIMQSQVYVVSPKAFEPS